MKRRSMKKFGAAALTLAMLGTSMTSIALAEEATTEAGEEETYDFGGQEVKVYGNQWGHLNPDSESDETIYLDYAKQVEEKYNIKLVYSAPDGYDGYNMAESLIASVNAGAGFTNILDTEPDALISFITGGFIADLTDVIDQLEVGSVYTNAVTWDGHCYGMTFDNVGDTYMMVYSRDYLEEIGMDVTPTEKFMNGEWSYEDMKEYLTEMKSKLPEGVYPLSMHYYHWATMAGAANGTVGISGDGTFGITSDGYIEALEFYRELMDAGLAAPMEIEWSEENETYAVDVPYGTACLSDQKAVMTCLESWQLGGLEDSIGSFGITLWPWGSEVTCDGDYTTLSDNYKTSQAYWASTVIISDAEAQTGIEPIVLMKIAQDYYALCSSSGDAARHAAWEAEQAGETPVIGYEAGSYRNFCTEEDYQLYDWGHTRVTYDWSKPFDNAEITNVWEDTKYAIAVGEDARSTAESWYQSGVAAAADKGITLK